MGLWSSDTSWVTLSSELVKSTTVDLLIVVPMQHRILRKSHGNNGYPMRPRTTGRLESSALLCHSRAMLGLCSTPQHHGLPSSFPLECIPGFSLSSRCQASHTSRISRSNWMGSIWAGRPNGWLAWIDGIMTFIVPMRFHLGLTSSSSH